MEDFYIHLYCIYLCNFYVTFYEKNNRYVAIRYNKTIINI